MPLPPLVSVADFETRLGAPLDAADRSRAGALLADVSAEVRAVTGLLYVDTTGALTAVPDVVASTTLHAAVSYWRNPSGLQSETVGAYSYTTGRTTGSTSVGVFLNAGHVAALRSASSRRGAVMVPLSDPLPVVLVL